MFRMFTVNKILRKSPEQRSPLKTTGVVVLLANNCIIGNDDVHNVLHCDGRRMSPLDNNCTVVILSRNERAPRSPSHFNHNS